MIHFLLARIPFLSNNWGVYKYFTTTSTTTRDLENELLHGAHNDQETFRVHGNLIRGKRYFIGFQHCLFLSCHQNIGMVHRGIQGFTRLHYRWCACHGISSCVYPCMALEHGIAYYDERNWTVWVFLAHAAIYPNIHDTGLVVVHSQNFVKASRKVDTRENILLPNALKPKQIQLCHRI